MDKVRDSEWALIHTPDTGDPERFARARTQHIRRFERIRLLDDFFGFGQRLPRRRTWGIRWHMEYGRLPHIIHAQGY